MPCGLVRVNTSTGIPPGVVPNRARSTPVRAAGTGITALLGADGAVRRAFLGRRRHQVERRRLVPDQELELVPEFLQREMRDRRETGDLVRVLEVVAAQPDHVSPGDR